MRSLVLGGSGFIGSHVVDALRAAGHSVTVFDRGPEQFRDPLPDVTYVFGDFADKNVLVEVMADMDVIFHLISTTFPGTANLDPKADVTGNLLSTLSLIELMNLHGIRRLVYLSSGGTVYGCPDMEPIPENHPLRPINSYGIVKAAIEQYLEMYRINHGLQPIAIRAANPFGPRQGHAGVQGVISTFLHRVRGGQPIEIWGDGSVVRDYLYVADLARLCVLAAESGIVGAMNAGSGMGRSLNDIVKAVAETTGLDVATEYRLGRTLDVPRSVLDITYAREALDWSPSTDFDLALAKTWQWIQGGAF